MEGVRTANRAGLTTTLVEHFDGTRWRIVKSPNVSTAFGQSNNLTSITAVAPDDIWAAGYAITKGQSGIEMILEHWDGAVWHLAASPSPLGTDQLATGIDAVATNDIWAVGFDVSGSPTKTLAAHWDGAAWTIVATPNIGGGSPADSKLESVTAVGANDMWAVGWENNIGGLNKRRTITMHWARTAWTVVPSPNNVLTTTPLGATALPGGTVWAVGGTELPGQCCLRTLVMRTADG